MAGDVLASEQSEIHAHASANRKLAADHGLQLAPAQAAPIGESTVKLDAEREARVEIVEGREAAGVNMAVAGLNAERTHASVTRKQIAEVGVDAGFAGERLLRNQGEPVVDQSRAELLAGISSGKLEVQTGGQRGNRGVRGCFVEVPQFSL